MKDIFTKLREKIAETLLFEPEVEDRVQTVEYEERNYGDSFQAIVEGLGNDLPAIIVSTLPPDSRGENTTTGQDEYYVKCACLTVVQDKNQETARETTQEIVHYVENVIRNQKSGTQDFNGHGAITMENPITTFEWTEFNNKYIYIATTEFTVLTIQLSDV